MPARAVRNRTVGYYVQSGFMLTVCVCVCVCVRVSRQRRGKATQVVTSMNNAALNSKQQVRVRVSGRK